MDVSSLQRVLFQDGVDDVHVVNVAPESCEFWTLPNGHILLDNLRS